MSTFCKHEWKLLTETVTKSKFEIAIAPFIDRVTKIDIPPRMCDASRKHIQVFTCEKCGKLKRFVEEI